MIRPGTRFGSFPPRAPVFPPPLALLPAACLDSFPLPLALPPGGRFGLFPARIVLRPPRLVTRHLRQPSFRFSPGGSPLRLRPAPSVVLHGLWAPGPLALHPGRPSLFPRPPVCPLFCPLGAFQPHCLGQPLPVAPSHLLVPANPTDPFPSCPPPTPPLCCRLFPAVASSRQTRPTLFPAARRSSIPDPGPPLLLPLSCRRRFPAAFLPSRSPTPTGGSSIPSFSLLSEKEGESREAFPRIFVSLQP